MILLRSDIRLAPSGIRFASFRANRISLKSQGFNITIAVAIISLFAKAKNITKKAEKERASRNFVTVLLSLSVFIAGFAFVLQVHRAMPYPYFKLIIMPILAAIEKERILARGNGNRALIQFKVHAYRHAIAVIISFGIVP